MRLLPHYCNEKKNLCIVAWIYYIYLLQYIHTLYIYIISPQQQRKRWRPWNHSRPCTRRKKKSEETRKEATVDVTTPRRISSWEGGRERWRWDHKARRKSHLVEPPPSALQVSAFSGRAGTRRPASACVPPPPVSRTLPLRRPSFLDRLRRAFLVSRRTSL